MKSHNLTLYAIAACLGLAVLTAWATLAPSISLPPSGMNDKFWHALAFGAMIFPVAVLTPKHLLLSGACLALYGGAIEMIQPYVGRSRELADFFANCIGLCLGAFIGLFMRKLVLRLRPR